jgi:hypothetical protein
LGAAIVTPKLAMPSPSDPAMSTSSAFEQLVAKGQRLTADGEMTAAPAALGEALGLRRGDRGTSPTPKTRRPT